MIRYVIYFFTFKDNAELFAMMEKTRMYIFRNLDPEVWFFNCELLLWIYLRIINGLRSYIIDWKDCSKTEKWVRKNEAQTIFF